MSELSAVMAAVNDINKSHGVTQRGGKKYTEVAKRVEAFRTHFGLQYGITTNIIIDDGIRVLIKAQIYDLSNPSVPVGEGYAEEIRGVGHFEKGDKRNINTAAAIENCETSAIGRALATLGLHGGQYASADELAKFDRNNNAIDNNKDNNNLNQETKPDPKVDVINAIHTRNAKVDWTLYIAKQQEAITRMKTLTALSSWTNNEAKNLENLAAADKPKWTALFNFWSARNEEIKNG